jgi:hypothetical protein
MSDRPSSRRPQQERKDQALRREFAQDVQFLAVERISTAVAIA